MENGSKTRRGTAMITAEDVVAIKLEVLHATISAFALRGYSGDLHFHLEDPPLKAQVYLKPNGSLAAAHRDVLKSLADSWASVDTFVDQPGTYLRVRFPHGIITKLDLRDQTL